MWYAQSVMNKPRMDYMQEIRKKTTVMKTGVLTGGVQGRLLHILRILHVMNVQSCDKWISVGCIAGLIASY